MPTSSIAITSGFFNAHFNETTNAYDRLYTVDSFANLFNGVLTDGIFKNYRSALEVRQMLDPGMGIRVVPGKAWFNGIFCVLDSPTDLEISAAHNTLDRIDAVILNINKTEGSRYARIYIVTGTPATNPVNPTPSTGTDNYAYPLAYVSVKHGVTSIRTADITSNRGNVDCPWVGAIDAKVNMTGLYSKWDQNWDSWLADKQKDYNTRLDDYTQWYTKAVEHMEEDLKPIVFGRVSINTDEWETYTPEPNTPEARIKNMGYIYRGLMDTNAGFRNVTADMRPYITWDLYYLKNCRANILNMYQCTNGGIYIYADAIPSISLYTVSLECRKAVT